MRTSPHWEGAVPTLQPSPLLPCWDAGLRNLTDVDGVYTADPRVVENPIKLKEISYEGMLELARLGAGVLHSRSVEFAKKYNVRLHVRSSFSMEEGTIVMPQEEMVEKYLISGVTAKKDEAKINIRDIEDKPGIAAGLFELLAAEKIYIYMIVHSTGLKNRASISFTVLKQDLDRAMAIAEKIRQEFRLRHCGLQEGYFNRVRSGCGDAVILRGCRQNVQGPG
jgi:aspartate kinase